MKIVLSAMEPGLDSDVDPLFGRSHYFVVVEPETMQIETFKNPYLDESGGAGISTAQLICSKGVGAVITGKIGPKAHQVLSAAGVRMLTGVSGRILDAIQRFKSGNLLDGVDAGTGSGMSAGSGKGSGMGMGTGRVTGMRLGTGMGRGMGRGMGCGGGRGKAMGAGMDGASQGRSFRAPRESERWSQPASDSGGREDIAFLKQQAKALAEELGKIQQRIEEMENK
jgi:predicted Fe-Mo cluster-binding NifX family protein